MTNTTRAAKPTLAQRGAYEAKVRRGRQFMRIREAFVTGEECLPIMIMACIAEGARTRDDIVRNVPRFVGHSYADVGRALDLLSGASVDQGYWYRDDAKVYHLHLPIEPLDPPVRLNLGPIQRKVKRPMPSSDLDQPY